MDNIVNLLRKITPEMLDLLEKRYAILKNIYFYQPIGRRLLAAHMDIGERVVRKELDFLKEQNLINITPAGMELEVEGIQLIEELQSFIHKVKGLHELEARIRDILNIDEVYIANGDSDTDLSVKKDMGRIAASIIRQRMKDVSIIAVSGGSTIAEVAEQMPVIHIKNDIEVVPARGGLGEIAEYQANAIAAKLAGKMNSKYKLLYVPDNLSREALERIIREPPVEEVINKIREADILLFGIGRAEDMASRRKLSKDLVDLLKSKGAAAEALGFYFDSKGNLVYSSTSIGLSLENFSNIPVAVAVAGGTKKAEAIVAANQFRRKTILVTDEGAAKEIIKNS
jgi:central glycolytic genes regulator